MADEGGEAARDRFVAPRPHARQKHEEIARELEWQQQRLGDALEHSLDQVIDDDVLRLIFTACHPVLAVKGRIALTLRLIGGLTTAEITRAFLVPEKTLGQRISLAPRRPSRRHTFPLRRRVGTSSVAGLSPCSWWST
jgi:predicted RNA polymerase sigma factor